MSLTHDFLRVLDPSLFVSHFVKEGVRSDGRSFADFRPSVISRSPISTAPAPTDSEGRFKHFAGSSMVRIGGTAAIATISACIEKGGSSRGPAVAGAAAASMRSPSHSTTIVASPGCSLAVTVMLPAAASSSFRPGPGSMLSGPTSISKQGFDLAPPVPSAEQLAEAVAQVTKQSNVMPEIRQLLIAANKSDLAVSRPNREALVTDELGDNLGDLVLEDSFEGHEEEAEEENLEQQELGTSFPGYTCSLTLSAAFTMFDGNAFDVAILAAASAIIGVRTSKTHTLGEILSARSPVPCRVLIPYPASVVLLDTAASGREADALMADPSSLEEMAARERCSVVLGLPAQGHDLRAEVGPAHPFVILFEHQAGGQLVPDRRKEVEKAAVTAATARAAELAKALQAFLVEATE
jgi:exosome complex RNA-binding protein Rrp42 (RNase PH superfamily)